MLTVGRMGRLGGDGGRRFNVGKLTRSPTRASAAAAGTGTAPMTGRASLSRRCCRRRWSGRIDILGGQVLHRLIPIKVTHIDRFSRLEVVPAQGVIPREHEVIEILTGTVLGHASPLGDVKGRLLLASSLLSASASATGGRLLQLPSDLGRLLPQSLAGLLPGLLVADVVPQSCLVVHLEESAGRTLGSPLLDDFQSHDGLVEPLGIDVLDLATFDPLAVPLVAGMVVGTAAAAVEDVVVGRIADVLEGPVGVLLGMGRISRRNRSSSRGGTSSCCCGGDSASFHIGRGYASGGIARRHAAAVGGVGGGALLLLPPGSGPWAHECYVSCSGSRVDLMLDVLARFQSVPKK